LKNDSRQPRIDAAIALSKIGPGAYEAIPALIQRLKDKEWAVQSCAAWALQKITGEKFPRRDYTRWQNWWLENKNRKKKAFGNAKSQQK